MRYRFECSSAQWVLPAPGKPTSKMTSLSSCENYFENIFFKLSFKLFHSLPMYPNHFLLLYWVKGNHIRIGHVLTKSHVFFSTSPKKINFLYKIFSVISSHETQYFGRYFPFFWTFFETKFIEKTNFTEIRFLPSVALI